MSAPGMRALSTSARLRGSAVDGAWFHIWDEDPREALSWAAELADAEPRRLPKNQPKRTGDETQAHEGYAR